jgi:hypothetical protein
MPEWRLDLWLAVILVGAYHGFNPGMGWPLAVSNGLTERRAGAVFRALVPLAAGHFLAMAVSLLPFGLLASLFFWNREIRIGAGLIVVLFGLYKLIDRRHPRFLARIRPSQLALWSFLVAIAHGAGLMLVPFFLALCTPEPTAASDGTSHADVMQLMQTGLGVAVAVSVIHTLAMIITGGVIAWAVYRYLGLGFLRKSWFNLEIVWATSLILTGAFASAIAWYGEM